MFARSLRIALSLSVINAAFNLERVAIAQQATMQFTVARDNSIDGWEGHNGFGDPPVYDKTLETEEFTNFGLAAALRARKGNQHALILDWDTDAINAFVASNVDTTKPYAWTLNVYPLSAPPENIPIETLESLNDWTEGDGDDSYANFNWSPDTMAVTNNFAQTAWMEDEDGDRVLDLENSLPWIDNDPGSGGINDDQYSILARADNFSRGTRVPDYINSEPLIAADLGDAAADATFATVELDAELIDAVLHDANNRGIVFGSVASFENWQVYSRENDGFGGIATEFPGPYASFLEITYTPGGGGLQGDFDKSGSLDAADLDGLTGQSALGTNPAAYDLNGDSLVNKSDVDIWAKDLFGGWIGDANLDHEFNSGDLVTVFTSGKYETGESAVWSQGDFNGDGLFNTGDLVAAFSDGGYEQGMRAAVSSVPEPCTLNLLLMAMGTAAASRRRFRRDD